MYQGRSGRSQHGHQPNVSKKSTVNQAPSPPFGSLIRTLRETDFLASDEAQSSHDEPEKITHSEYLASYNWLDHGEPTVLIPGAPPAWTPLKEPRRLAEDRGNYFRDVNAAHFPPSPQEPGVQSILVGHENFDTQKIDLFACSSTLGNLLRFVRKADKPFRFFVEAVGKTVFFTRHENSPTQLIEGVRGYGHTFPETYTTWDAGVRASISHQRLLRYDLAGLDCILRFTCDGYLPSKVPQGSRTWQSAGEEKDISSVLDSVNVGSSVTGGKTQVGPLQIRNAGQKIPQEAVFDLKTRSAWRKDLNVLEDELPRFWLAQIHNFILARHKNGAFIDIEVQEIQNEVQEWEDANQNHIKIFVWLLREIIAAVKLRKDRKLEVCYQGLDTLELREQDTDEHNVLSHEMEMRWFRNMSLNDKHPEDDEKLTTSKYAPRNEFDVSDDDGPPDFDSGEESEKDYTACSADDCGYCGHCSY